MKRVLSAVIILPLLFIYPKAALDTKSVESALPEEVREYVAVSPDEANAEDGLKGIFEGFVSQFGKGIRRSLGEGMIILAIGAVSSIAGMFVHTAESSVLKKASEMTAVCAAASVCINKASGMLESCAGSIDRLGIFSSALIPVYASAVAMSGSPLAAVSASSGTLIFSNILILLASEMIIPTVYFHIALSAVGCICENRTISEFSGMIKNAMLGFFKYFLMLYTVYISLSGLISSGADAAALKTAKAAISGSVPVMGTIVSDVSDTMLNGAAVLKNSVGLYGFIGAVAICLVPFAGAAAKYVVFKLLAVISSSLCRGAFSEFLASISESYSIALGLLGTCCAIQFLSFVISAAVIKT